ncbi:MAG: ribulokinase [Pricia sp.]
MQTKKYVIGVDFGTASVRTIIVDTENGNQLAVAEAEYTRWKAGKFCDVSKSRFRQHPLDYIESFEMATKDALVQISSEQRTDIVALSIDTTGSTPAPVNKEGMPLALLPSFQNNPNAMFWLWKDHTAWAEAEKINQIARNFDPDYLKYVGGIYSSEWFWAKLAHALKVDGAVADACHSWVEHCDWFPFLLTGGNNANTIKRSVCAAGHKALWSEEWNGLPSEAFFHALHPQIQDMLTHLHQTVYTADCAVGTLSEEWATKLGLSIHVQVGIGVIDAHVGAVGGEIEPYHLSKVMGTSTCDMLVAPFDEVGDTLVEGICGQVDGSIIPEMIGMEAGQSAFGDVYSWFRDILMWPLKNYIAKTTSEHSEQTLKLYRDLEDTLLKELNEAAATLPIDAKTELAVDWLNGRRTPDADQSLKAAIQGLDLGTDAPRIYRALAEATCFGAKKIVKRFQERGIPIKGIIGVGGVAKKSPFIMQMMADVLNMPIRIHSSDQTCALGSAMFAATVAGVYPKVEDAMKKMGQGFDMQYVPDDEKTEMYALRYTKYLRFCDAVESSF